MTIWTNGDSLSVRFGRDESGLAKGAEKGAFDNGNHVIEFLIRASDLQSATAAILGSVSSTAEGVGTLGVVVPEGARISAIEIVTETAFTSTGTIGTASVEIGLVKLDRTTELDYDGLVDANFVGSRIDGVGERTYIEIGSTGVGALIATTLTEPGLISVRAAQHASHPLAAGLLRCRLYYRFV